MGKGCVRFKKLNDPPLDLIRRTIARVRVDEHMANYRAARALLSKGKSSAKKSAVAKANKE